MQAQAQPVRFNRCFNFQYLNNHMNVSALDENGKKVDWFFLYKVPQLAAAADTDTTTGYEYVYYDATIDDGPEAKQVVDKSRYVLNSNNGALNLTLNSVF